MDLIKAISVSLLILIANFAQANSNHFGLHVGVADGGDTLGTVTFTDHTKEDLDAGSGVIIGAYAIVPLTERGLAIKMGLGYHSDDVTASNGEVSFSRYPIDLIIFADGPKWQAGLGLTYHINPTYEYNFSGEGSISADDALGTVFEVNYKTLGKHLFGPSFQLGLRYTEIEYKFHGISRKFDGSNFAFIAGMTF